MGSKQADGMATCVDPDQAATPDVLYPKGAVWFGSALFVQTYLSHHAEFL